MCASRHFPEEGWVVFDPTPVAAGGVAGRARIKWLERARAWADYGRVRWADVMLDYGLDNQAEGVRAALRFLQGEGVSLDFSWLGSPDAARAVEERNRRSPWKGLLTLLVLLGVAAGAVVSRGRPDGDAGPPELRAARRAVLRLRRRWVHSARTAADAPDEGASLRQWSAWAERTHGLPDATDLVDRYYASRFGSAPVPADLVPRLRSLLKDSPRSIRR